MNPTDKWNSEEKLQAFYGTVKFHFYWMAAITSPSAQPEEGIDV